MPYSKLKWQGTTTRGYSISSGYSGLINASQKVVWARIVWARASTPKESFISFGNDAQQATS